jgi:hypothetical protein
VDVPQQGTEPTLTDEKPAQQPENPRLQAFEKRLAKLGEWALSAQEGFKGLQEKQDLLAADLASHQAALQTQQQTAAVDVVMGYRPSVEQLILLFEALAQWQHGAPEVEKSARASFKTKDNNEGGGGGGGKEVNYSYATPGEISSLARTAGEVGLAHFHREVVLSDYSVIRTYLVHKCGGFIYSDVPLLTRENKLLGPMQVWAVANTSARRLGLLSVIGIMPSDTDDDGNLRQPEGQANGRGRSIRTVGASSGSSTRLGEKPPPLPEANIKRIGTSKPVAVGGEPGQAAAPIPTTATAGYAPA